MTDDEDTSKKEADQRTYAMTFILVGAACVMMALPALILPQFLGIFLVIGGMGLFFAIHYVLWGWWLRKILEKDDKQDD